MITRSLIYSIFVYLLLFGAEFKVFGQTISKAEFFSDNLKEAKLDTLYNLLLDSISWDQEILRHNIMVDSFYLDDSVELIIPELDLFKVSKLSWKEQDSIFTILTEKKSHFWEPNPYRATWMALLIPGGGQIYNKKYWKLPVVFGGILGCAYALSWNGQMYSDYSQAYLDIMDNNPETKSYENFLPPRFDYESNKEWLKDVLKNRKDKYRRYRDLSIFAFAGVYIISVIDAYVDAELSLFDVSRDLSIKVRSDIIDTKTGSIGFNLAFNF